MPEFVPRPNLPEGLAALVAQIRAKQMDPIAAGIASFANNIGGAVGDHFDGKKKIAAAALEQQGRADLAQQGSVADIIKALAASGAITLGNTADIPGLMTGKTSLPISKPKADMTPKGGNKPPPGFRFLPDGDLEAIPGGPAALKIEATAGKETEGQDAALEQAQAQITKVDQALKNVSGWSTGWGKATVGRLPGSQAKDLQGDVDTIKANLGFSTLAEMKRASPTGGALGAISESEMRLLTSARESLDTDQSQAQLIRNLKAVKTHYTNWSNAVMKAREEGAKSAPAAKAAPKTVAAVTPGKVGRFQIEAQ